MSYLADKSEDFSLGTHESHTKSLITLWDKDTEVLVLESETRGKYLFEKVTPGSQPGIRKPDWEDWKTKPCELPGGHVGISAAETSQIEVPGDGVGPLPLRALPDDPASWFIILIIPQDIMLINILNISYSYE